MPYLAVIMILININYGKRILFFSFAIPSKIIEDYLFETFLPPPTEYERKYIKGQLITRGDLSKIECKQFARNGIIKS